MLPKHKLYDFFAGQLNFKVEMTINPVFENDRQNDGRHVYDCPDVAISRYSKVRHYVAIYLSRFSKSNLTFRFQICD